jgi:hypothetical protein
MHINRFGFTLAALGIVLGILYVIGLMVAFLFGSGFPLTSGTEKYINVVTYLTVPVIVLLWAAIHQATPAGRKVFSLGSLALIIIFATLTSINRYNALTLVPQATASGHTAGLEWFLPYGWPSIMLAMEVQGWGVYLGLACLCLAAVFQTGNLERAIFWLLVASGILCLLAAFGQVIESATLNLLGVLAWGPGLIVLFVLLALWFKRREAAGLGQVES